MSFNNIFMHDSIFSLMPLVVNWSPILVLEPKFPVVYSGYIVFWVSLSGITILILSCSLAQTIDPKWLSILGTCYSYFEYQNQLDCNHDLFFHLYSRSPLYRLLCSQDIVLNCKNYHVSPEFSWFFKVILLSILLRIPTCLAISLSV